MGRETISAFVVCCNEKEHIRRCLDSVKWCDELVIVDSGSTDGTLEICREYTDRIFIREWPGFVAQKRFGLEQCTGEWVLNIDADEEVSDELRSEIEQLLSSGSQDVQGCYLLRVVFHLGKWWRKGGWYPEYRLRLSRRAATTWGGVDPHEKAIVQGKTVRLKGELRHYTYGSIADQVNSLNRLSSVSAESQVRDGKRASVIGIFTRPIVRFLRFYFLRGGIREGFPGLIVAVLEGYYVFLKQVKVWELRRSGN